MDTLKQNQVLAAVMLILCATSVQAEDWRTLRGPHFDGSASLNDAAIATGALKLKTVWKQPFGSGYSGASIAGDRLVSAMADKEANQEFLVAKSVETGETLWRSATGKIMVGENGSFDGPIATPAIDEERAYHLSPHGNLAAYDIATGGVVWAHDLKSEYGAEPNFYGFGACPILHAGLLIVPVGAPDAMA
ncbi:MAG: PQQ-binding-like beta-propeller repeat protein, partial [Planctomycetota bacterium]